MAAGRGVVFPWFASVCSGGGCNSISGCLIFFLCIFLKESLPSGVEGRGTISYSRIQPSKENTVFGLYDLKPYAAAYDMQLILTAR